MARTLVQGTSTSLGTVTVYWAGTVVKPSIYVGPLLSTTANPQTAAVDGSYAFWIDDGHYTIVNGTKTGDRDIRVGEAPLNTPNASGIYVYKAYGLAAGNVQDWIEAFVLAPTFVGPMTGVTTLAVSSTSTFTGAATFSDSTVVQSANGGQWISGQISELITIAASATTDSTANLLPANSIIEAVVVRVTTVIPTATTFTVGDATTAARFLAATDVAATTTGIGTVHWNGVVSTTVAGPTQAAAAKIRITPNGTPANNTGRLRVTVFYRQFVAPTS